MIQSLAADFEHLDLFQISWKLTSFTESKSGCVLCVCVRGVDGGMYISVSVHQLAHVCVHTMVSVSVLAGHRGALGSSFGSVLVYSRPETLAQ